MREDHRAALRRARRYFEEHFDAIRRDYPGEYVAIAEERVLDHGQDLAALTVRTQRPGRTVFISFVGASPQVRRRLRTPRVIRRPAGVA